MSRERNVEALGKHTPGAQFVVKRDYFGDAVLGSGSLVLNCSCGEWSEDAEIGSFAEHQASAGIGSYDALTDDDCETIRDAPLSDHWSHSTVETAEAIAEDSRTLRAALARAFGKPTS